MHRVHRTFLERFRYLAIFECRHCQTEESFPRAWAMHLGDAVRCSKCGTFRVTRLKEPDRIDKMHTGFLNFLERIAGGRLYHCRFCRLQFWDRRLLASELRPKPESAPEPMPEPSPEPVAATPRPDTASSGE